MEVQQAPAPAAHGAASVMAAVVTHSGRSDGDTEMQQTASGPSQPAGARRSPSPSAQPAAATAHTRSMLTAATQPSQHGPVASAAPKPAQHVPSSLATLSTGSREKAGGSVGMRSIPRLEAGAVTSAPHAPGGGIQDADMDAADEDGLLQPAVSSPMQAAAARAGSVSLSGQGGLPAAAAAMDFAEHNPVLAAAVAQSSVVLVQPQTQSACEGQNIGAGVAPGKSQTRGEWECGRGALGRK